MAWGREAQWRSFVTDSASALVHWSHLCCKTSGAMSKVWENPISWRGNLVHLEVPASSSSGISFPVPLGGPNSNAVSRITCWLFSPCNGVRKTSRTGDHEWFRCYSSDLVKGIDIASTLEPVDTSQWPLLQTKKTNQLLSQTKYFLSQTKIFVPG